MTSNNLPEEYPKKMSSFVTMTTDEAYFSVLHPIHRVRSNLPQLPLKKKSMVKLQRLRKTALMKKK